MPVVIDLSQPEMPDSETQEPEHKGKKTKCVADEDIQTLVVKLAAFQTQKNRVAFITYESENPNTQKAKLLRGENGIEGNIGFLEIVKDTALSKKQVRKVLEGVLRENSLKLKKDEKSLGSIRCKGGGSTCRELSRSLSAGLNLHRG